jgi:hypothetical protein
VSPLGSSIESVHERREDRLRGVGDEGRRG